MAAIQAEPQAHQTVISQLPAMPQTTTVTSLWEPQPSRLTEPSHLPKIPLQLPTYLPILTQLQGGYPPHRQPDPLPAASESSKNKRKRDQPEEAPRQSAPRKASQRTPKALLLKKKEAVLQDHFADATATPTQLAKKNDTSSSNVLRWLKVADPQWVNARKQKQSTDNPFRQ